MITICSFTPSPQRFVRVSLRSTAHSSTSPQGEPPSHVSPTCRWWRPEDRQGSPLPLTITSAGESRPPARLKPRCHCSLRSLGIGGKLKVLVCEIQVASLRGGWYVGSEPQVEDISCWLCGIIARVGVVSHGLELLQRGGTVACGYQVWLVGGCMLKL